MSSLDRKYPIARAALAAALGLSTACGGDPGGTGPGTDGLNLRVETLFLVQSVQTRDGTVPLVADKDAYLRVFVLANEANTLTPSVRVTLLQNGAVLQQTTIPAGGTSVPTKVDQSSMNNSWNLKIPKAMVQPGLQVLAEVDPANEVEESDEQDNSFPVSGTPKTLSITALQPLRIRLVPVFQADNGLTGNVTAANMDSYLAFALKIHPLSSIDADLREPYTVNGLGFDPEGNTWQTAVADLDAVRTAEGSDRFYYGVVNTSYNGGGVVGIAAGIPASAALGWDRFPDAPITLAHEIGHDWGRYHAPCGGAGGPDPNYPYPEGLIGVYGLDVDTKEVKTPNGNTDIMGYCNARFWISDYTFTGIFNYRASHPSASIGAPVPALLVWGRIVDGVPALEPSFEVTAPPALPSGSGPYLVEGLDAAGRPVVSYHFDAAASPDMANDFRHFAFAIPLSGESAAKVATLRLVARGRESRIAATAASIGTTSGSARLATPITAPRTATMVQEGPDRVSLRWDAKAYPLVVARDAATGAILSLARGGTATVAAPNAAGVQLVYSDGIHSVRTSAGPAIRR
jgi:hypothetical protein